MSSRVTGSPLAWLSRAESAFDPKTGDHYRLTYNGPKIAIAALYLGFRNSGLRCTKTQKGPLWECAVEIGYDSSTGLGEVPLDHWNIDAEPVQVSIWANPEVAADMAAYGNQAEYKKLIDTAIKNGTALTGTIAARAVAQSVWLLLSRGTDAYEVKRTVATRVRTFSLSYASRYVITAPEVLYTRATLITAFAIPTIVANQLPTDSGLPSLTGTAWAWKVRTDRSEIIPALSKVQETKDFVFAQWSTALYGAAV